MIAKLRQIYWHIHYKLVVKRSAAKEQTNFSLQNTFIMPSRFGWSIIALMLCLFVLGTNYQNNIILGVCFLLLAVILLSIFHAYFFFIQHKLQLHIIEPDFECKRLTLKVTLSVSGPYKGGELKIQFGKENHQVKISALANKPQIINIKLPKYTRGIHQLPTITISASYGFGFFQCWSYVLYPHDFIVYPGIEKMPVNFHQFAQAEDTKIKSDSKQYISDNLQGIRSHQKSDPLHQVSWKHVAKGQGMVSKDFAESASITGWLKLSDYHDLGIEKSLRVLCFQIQELHKTKAKFGLDLGNTKILPNSGDRHINECLLQLASFQPAIKHE